MKRKTHKPYQRLKGVLKEKGITYKEIGVVLGVSETAVSQKINGCSDFYIGEVKKIEDKYKIEAKFFTN